MPGAIVALTILVIKLLKMQNENIPMKGKAPVRSPIHHETPLLFQPPRFSKSVNTHAALCCGAKQTIGMTIKNHRPICNRRITDSMCGRILIARTLIITAEMMIALYMRVPCQRSGT